MPVKKGKKMKLSNSVMPVSQQGRKAIPCDAEAVESLVTSLREAPLAEVDGEFRPQAYGPTDRTFATASRAQGEGRRYAKAVAKTLGTTPKVNVYDNGKGEKLDEAGRVTKANKDTRYLWRLYLPVSKVEDQENAEQAA